MNIGSCQFSKPQNPKTPKPLDIENLKLFDSKLSFGKDILKIDMIQYSFIYFVDLLYMIDCTYFDPIFVKNSLIFSSNPILITKAMILIIFNQFLQD